MRTWVDTGPGRVDVTFQRGLTLVMIDLLSGLGGEVNTHILAAAANAAAMGFKVFVIRSSLYEYTTPHGQPIPRRMDATPASTWGILARFLYLTLNLIIPMLTDTVILWRCVAIPAAFVAGAYLDIPVYSAFLDGFSLTDSLPAALRPATAGIAYPVAQLRSKMDHWNGQAFGISGFLYMLLKEGVHCCSLMRPLDPLFDDANADPTPQAMNAVATMWDQATNNDWSLSFAAFPLEPALGFVSPHFPQNTYYIGNAAYATATGRNAVAASINAGRAHHIHAPPGGAEVPIFYTRAFSRLVVTPQNMVGAVPAPTAHAAAGAAAALQALAPTQVSFLN